MNNTFRLVSALIMFLIFISCKEVPPQSNRLSGSVEEKPETRIERNIKLAYPGCKIYQYKDNDLCSQRYLVITTDTVILVIDANDNEKYPFDQNIYITKL